MTKLNTTDERSSYSHSICLNSHSMLSLSEQYANFVKTFRFLDPKGQYTRIISSNEKKRREKYHHHNSHNLVIPCSTYIQVVVFADAGTFLWYILENIALAHHNKNQDIIFTLFAFTLFMYALTILGEWPASTSLVMEGSCRSIVLRNAPGNILRFRYRSVHSFLVFIGVFHLLSVAFFGSIICMFRPLIVSFPLVEWIMTIINCLIALSVVYCFNLQIQHTAKTALDNNSEINKNSQKNSQHMLKCKLPSAAAVVNIMPFLRIHMIISRRALDLCNQTHEARNNRVIIASGLFVVASAIINAMPHCNQEELCQFLVTLWNWSIDPTVRDTEFSFAFEDVSARQRGLNDAGQPFAKQSFHVTNSVSFFVWMFDILYVEFVICWYVL